LSIAADTANKQLRDAGFVKWWNKDKNGKEFFYLREHFHLYNAKYHNI
jgi:hypothetical protein